MNNLNSKKFIAFVIATIVFIIVYFTNYLQHTVTIDFSFNMALMYVKFILIAYLVSTFSEKLMAKFIDKLDIGDIIKELLSKLRRGKK